MIDFYKILFGKLHINYCQTWLSERLKELPYMNSMFGIKSILSIYGIDSSCVKLLKKDELRFVNMPCITLFDDKFVIIDAATSNNVSISAPKTGTIKIPMNDFSAKWDGCIITTNTKKVSGEPDFREHLKDERLSNLKSIALCFAIATTAIIALFSNQFHYQWQWWILCIINISGCCVSYLLLQKQLHIPNQFTDRLCGLVHESHCENVTNSEGATVLGLAKLSEIGTAFFLVNLIVLLIWPTSIFFLAITGAIVLPFSFWSIWYQKYKAKSWCVLCLMTLGLMWLQTAMYLVGGYYSPVNISLWTGISLSAVYCIAVLLINKIMIVLEQKRQGEFWQAKYNLLKSDEKVVCAIESDAPAFDTSQEVCSEMVFGNPTATKEITVFSNPYCNPCAKLHNQIKNRPGRNVKVRYTFTYFSDELSTVNRMLIAAYQQLGPETTWDIMTRWYDAGKKEGIHFFDSYRLKDDTEAVEREFKKQNAWRSNNKFKGTPTIMVNGRELVPPYSVQDYIYIPDKFE